MSESSNEESTAQETGDRSQQQDEIAAVQDDLDAQSEGEGLAAEAGGIEETGLAEG